MKIIDIVKDKSVTLSYFNSKTAYYNATYNKDEYEFPVDLEDVGSATLLPVDKAMLFMRYIRKAIDNGTFIKVLDRDYLEENILLETESERFASGIDIRIENFYSKWNGDWYHRWEESGIEFDSSDWDKVTDKEEIKEILEEIEERK
jgi:hypothetical protein